MLNRRKMQLSSYAEQGLPTWPNALESSNLNLGSSKRKPELKSVYHVRNSGLSRKIEARFPEPRDAALNRVRP